MNENVKNQVKDHIKNAFAKDDGTFTAKHILKQAFVDYLDAETEMGIFRTFKPRAFTDENVDFDEFVDMCHFTAFVMLLAQNNLHDPNDDPKLATQLGINAKNMIDSVKSAFDEAVIEMVTDTITALGHLVAKQEIKLKKPRKVEDDDQ